MAEKLKITYDRIDDVLHIDKVAPYPEQGSERIDEDVVVRLNPRTGEVENIEIRYYFERISRGDVLELPLSANIRLAT